MASEQSPIQSQPEQDQAPPSGSAPIAIPQSPVAGIINMPRINASACVGNPRIAVHMVKKNPNLLSIPNMPGDIAVVVAANYGHKHMVHYLYSQTPDGDLNPDINVHGARLLMTCIDIEFFGIHVQLHPIRQNLKDLEKGYQGHITKENTMNKALTLPIDQLWNVMQYFGMEISLFRFVGSKVLILREGSNSRQRQRKEKAVTENLFIGQPE
ncbi:hypothetical protein RJ641_010426 [Dillenia turbinata]|uniref:Uncharacterized protein n=1 Tax=Dillenia turbinata TaxID=194707 RepID=A0AAN8Z4A2_9MAGN